ncbi:MAG: sugar ABC transporter permease [Christensenellaceae bacterium]|nr:sugar ABC transporter permease [Christensenellaceae bacterium]
MKKKSIVEFSFLFPALALFILFVLYPFIEGIPISFTNWDGLSDNVKYVGFRNYVRMFSDRHFVNATSNTLIFMVIEVVFSNLLGLFFALLIAKPSRSNNIIRTMIFTPFCLSLLLSAYVWKYIYSDFFYGVLGIPSPLGDKKWVMAGLANIAVWRDAGYCMVVYIAAIQGISKEYYEVGDIEGCNIIQRFRYITLPMIGPAITANVTLLLSWGMKVFDYPMAATSGGPGRSSETVAMLIYGNLFTYFKAGYGQAIAIVFTISIFLLSFIVSYNLRKREVEL